ncbi:MAG TPA: hypothetical protein VF389_10680, partial [Woeseiaceae bacterium]
IRHRLQEPLTDAQELYYAGRPGAAAPASGLFKVHLQQQQLLVEAALGTKIEATISDDPDRKSARKKKKKKKKKQRASRTRDPEPKKQ